MACDRVVRWKGERRPLHEQLQFMLEDYFAGIATEVMWTKDRFFVNLPGAPSSPFRRFPEVPAHVRERYDDAEGIVGLPQRWIEVWPDTDCIYVMTRSMDPITNDLAEGFSQLTARYWGGERED